MRDRSEHSEMCPWVIGGECDCKKITVEIPISNQLTTALARAESAELEQFIPGCFVCPKCDFGLTKATIYMGSGNIGPTISNAVERCPNDNEVMVKETWRMRVGGLSKVCETQIKRAVESETRNRQLVQAMGKIQRVCNGEEQVADNDTEALQWIWREIEALALLKEMGKE